MSEVVRLVERVNCHVVVTADHGEHLGENGYYLHEEDSVSVRQVPWLIMNENEIGTVANTKDYSNSHNPASYSGSVAKVEDQLRHLGYKE
jgi:glucan phosphoethanolaminetransferase (alkaline phosphatase superfamily)